MPERAPPGPSKPGMAHTPESADAPIGLDEKIVDATMAEASRICPRRRRRTVDPAGTRRPDIALPELEEKPASRVETRGVRWTDSQSEDWKPERWISSARDGATGGRYDAPAAPFQSPMVLRKGGSGHGWDFSDSFLLYSTGPVHAAGAWPMALSLQRSAALAACSPQIIASYGALMLSCSSPRGPNAIITSGGPERPGCSEDGLHDAL